MHAKQSLSSHHRGELRIHIVTKPKVAHDKLVCYAARNGHVHKLGTFRTKGNGKATKTFHHHLKPGKTYTVGCKLFAKGTYKHSYTKPHHITIHS